ncbi:hypothetical protein BD777DRAFT_122592 [Yarrowia lipolytica]|nr:hypothetical protein BD777DRAFT_122592 [Yarrowia lipolytica]
MVVVMIVVVIMVIMVVSTSRRRGGGGGRGNRGGSSLTMVMALMRSGKDRGNGKRESNGRELHCLCVLNDWDGLFSMDQGRYI